MNNRLRFINKVESLGYIHRVDNYYILREFDGYINVSAIPKITNDITHFSFHKNFYRDVKNPYHHKENNYKQQVTFLNFICEMTPSTITFRSKDENEFYNFLISYKNLKRIILNKKLKKIRKINHIYPSKV